LRHCESVLRDWRKRLKARGPLSSIFARDGSVTNCAAAVSVKTQINIGMAGGVRCAKLSADEGERAETRKN